jgi:squalene-hopene/tetraprenyl-beta-curcumene cyclase
MVDPQRLRSAYESARAALLAERNSEGYWVGELSSSALATATAVTGLSIVDASKHAALIENGLRWLTKHQNADGGWGDTVKSFSNISTTMLCRAAFEITGKWRNFPEPVRRSEAWLAQRYCETPEQLAEAVRQRYGKDRTFSVPILMMCALAGLVPWKEVPRLPFELACVPQSLYRFARMPVVSYALPALIAIGQVVHHHRSTWNPVARLLRWLGKSRSLRVLERIQPSSGGFLEATPLTSFVVMSLAAMRRAAEPVSRDAEALRSGAWRADAAEDRSTPTAGAAPRAPLRKASASLLLESAERVIALGTEFIMNSVRPDGSWPIDTNLSIWVTTLSVNALAAAGDLNAIDRREQLLAWLLNQQTKDVHPYTGAAPGAWGWSHLPGSVPDCDDTPGAVLAHATLLWATPPDTAELESADRAYTATRERFLAESAKGTNTWSTEPSELDETRKRASQIRESTFGRYSRPTRHAIIRAGNWILGLQNRDLGWPTFCHGWGKLPFDRSGSDLTAHAMRALQVVSLIERTTWLRITRAFEQNAINGFAYLSRHQRPDGSWLPLWFGNQHVPDDINPVYGTARVLAAYRDLGRVAEPEAQRGTAFLLDVQNPDGGWGGAKSTPSSVEETALAVEILVDLAPPQSAVAVERGIEYLIRRVEDGTFTEPSPIGFYFAKLWYFEKLYPIIFTVAALGRALKQLA